MVQFYDCTSFKVTSKCWFPMGQVAVGDCCESNRSDDPPRHTLWYHQSRSALRPTHSQDHYQFNAKASKVSAMTNVLMRHFRRHPCYASSANTHLPARRWKFSPSSLRTVHFFFFFPKAEPLYCIHDFMWITSRSQITFCLHLQRKVLGCEGGRDEGMLRAVIEIKGSIFVFVESSQE